MYLKSKEIVYRCFVQLSKLLEQRTNANRKRASMTPPISGRETLVLMFEFKNA